jgi:hypothetical protein
MPVLMDADKTVIVGEALVVISELSYAVDVFMDQLAAKVGDETYEELLSSFTQVVLETRKQKTNNRNATPTEVMKAVDLKKIFRNDFFKRAPREDKGASKPNATSFNSSFKSSSDDKNSAEDALRRAREKLAKNKKKRG